MTLETVATIALAALALALLGLAITVATALLGRRGRRGSAAGFDGPLEQIVSREFARLDRVETTVDGLARRMPTVEEQGRRAVQRVGVVRFNPFEDTGGNQSFALAMLDSAGDGIVISSLHSRQQTRIYLKSIVAGKCETAVSDEEAEALRRAGASQ